MPAEAGILVTAKDAASGTLKKIGDGSKKSLDSVRELGEKAKRSFEAMGGAITAVNQGLELGKKAWELMRLAVVDTISASLQFRRQGDPVIKWFEDFRRESELLVAAIGDTFIPIVQGLAEAFGLVGNSTSKWLQAHRKLIATNILGFVINLSKGLVKGVAFASIQVAKAWYGWQQVIGVVQAAIGKFLASTVSGLNSILGALGLLPESFAGLAEDFDAFAESGADAALDASIAMGKLERQLTDIAGTALVKLDAAYVHTFERIQKSVSGTTRTIEEQKTAAEDLADTIDAITARRISAIEKRAALEESIAISLAENQQQRWEEISSTAAGITNEVVGAFAAQTNAAEAMAKAVANAVIDSVLVRISALAAEAAAGAFASQASIPFVGPALGAAAAAASGAAVAGLGAGLKALVGGLGGGEGGGGGGGAVAPDTSSFGSAADAARSIDMVGFATGGNRPREGWATPAGGGGANDGQRQQQVVIQNFRTWVPSRNEEMRMGLRLEEGARKRMAQQGLLIGQEGV